MKFESVKARLAQGAVRKISPEGLWSYLAYGAVQAPWTILDGLKDAVQLPRPSFVLAPWKSREEAQEAVIAALVGSVRRLCETGTMPAAYLSGGIDSGALVALMRRVFCGEIRTYCVTHEDARTDERRWARLVAERNGTRHVELPLTGEMIGRSLDEVVGLYDQPSMDGLNAYFAAKLITAAGEKSVVSGCAGDELFAGYGGFAKARFAAAVAPWVRWLPRSWGLTLTHLAPRESLRKLGMLVGCRGEPYFLTRRIFDDRRIAALMGEEVQMPPPEAYLPSDLPREFVNRVSWLELSTNLTSMYLRDSWQTAAPFGLDVRVPFLDEDLVQLLFSVPGEWKVAGDTPKPLLVRAAGEGLPAACVNRPKQGFSLPFDRYLSTTLKERVDDFLFGGNTKVFDARELSRVGKEYRRGRLHWGRVWALFMMESWCQANGMSRR